MPKLHSVFIMQLAWLISLSLLAYGFLPLTIFDGAPPFSTAIDVVLLLAIPGFPVLVLAALLRNPTTPWRTIGAIVVETLLILAYLLLLYPGVS
jgi:hypothetical protein